MLRRGQNGIASLAGCVLALTGCSGDFIANQTEELAGNITVVFINNTPFRASFSFGAFNALDRNPPGSMVFQQIQVEANTSSNTSTISCRRDFAVGTEELLIRAVQTNSTSLGGFNPDIFRDDVAFSSAPLTAVGNGLPTDGTAKGRNFRVGVDYTCEDQLLVSFEVDDSAPGGFRIDLSVIPDLEPDR